MNATSLTYIAGMLLVGLSLSLTACTAPHPEVLIVFIDADAGAQDQRTLRHRIDLLDESVDYYYETEEDELDLVIFPITRHPEFNEPLAEVIRTRYEKPKFNDRDFMRKYLAECNRSRNKTTNIIATLPKINSFLKGRDYDRIAILYLSNMIHTDNNVDLSANCVSQCEEDFKDDISGLIKLIGEGNIFSGYKHVSVLIKSLGEREPGMFGPTFWESKVFQEHLGAHYANTVQGELIHALRALNTH